MTHTTLRKTNKLEIYETDAIRKNDVVQHPVFLDYNNEKHLVFFRVENQPQAAEDNMNKILDQLVEDKYGYSMRDSDSSTYEKTAGWEKEYVNGFMEEAKS